MRNDTDGNLYVAIYGHGRMLVFNKNGIPIAQVLLPGGDESRNLHSESMAVKPDTNDLLIATDDGKGGQAATIFHATVFAKALRLPPPVTYCSRTAPGAQHGYSIGSSASWSLSSSSSRW